MSARRPPPTRSAAAAVAILAAILAALVAAGVPVAAEGGASRTPVPIFDPPPILPDETVGTGIAPDVAVRVAIDARGRVQDVEVRSIRPSSEYDAAIERSVREQLLRWRYAPKLEDGRPVAAELEWTVVLVPRARQQRRGGGDVPSGPAATVPDAGASIAESWRAIHALSEQRKLEALDAAVSSARTFLTGEPTRAAGEAFVVHADEASEEVARVLAQNLDATFATLIGMFEGAIELQQPKYKLVAFIYNEREAYRRLQGEVLNVEWSAGFYNPAGLLAFHRQMPSDAAVRRILLHEATHAFVDRFLVRPGRVLPRWLGEGFAEYIGNSDIRKGRLVPGRTPVAEVQLTVDGLIRTESRQLLDVQATKRAMKRGEALSVAELVGATPEQFYGERHEEHYTMAWMFVHFLRDGREGWADEAFPLFMLYVAEGYPPEESFRAAYGVELDGVQAEFAEYVRKF